MTDILIIGGGPAGLTAAIYAARAGKSVVVCEKESMGGQITHAHRVRNFPGFSDTSGIELGDAFCAHAMEAGADVELTAVLCLRKEPDGSFTVETEDGTMRAKAVIFAGGAKPRLLGTARETDLLGRGVSYCALCDGEFYRNQDVAVVGGGNTAVSDAAYLSGICRSVTLVHRRDGFRAEQTELDLLRNLPNVRILTPYVVGSLCGEDALESLTLTNVQTGKPVSVPVRALFVALGRVPDCSLLGDMAVLDKSGYALTEADCAAKTAGLFIAGDCRKKPVYQLTTAAADGTIAAISACSYVDRNAAF